MIIFLSGQDGVKREIPETVTQEANVMLSFNTAIIIQEQDTKPNGRLQRLIRARKASLGKRRIRLRRRKGKKQ